MENHIVYDIAGNDVTDLVYHFKQVFDIAGNDVTDLVYQNN